MPAFHVPATDKDFVTFINEFLFNPSRQDSSARPFLRNQRSLSRHKRCKIMWRAAAKSLMKNRYSSQDPHVPFADHCPRELPFQVSSGNGASSKGNPLPAAIHEMPHQAFSDNGHFRLTAQSPFPQQLDTNQHSSLTTDGAPRSLPLEVSIDEGHASPEIHSSSADQFLRNSPSLVVLDDGHCSEALSTDQVFRYLPSECSLDYAGGLATIDFQQQNRNRSGLDAIEKAPFIAPASSRSTVKGTPFGCHSKAQPPEGTPTPTVPKYSSRKPPRPPRAGTPRSGSSRAIRLKNAARRPTVDNVRTRKQKLPKSSKNATTMWALIITLCFASIMLVQGFLGSTSKDMDSIAEGQLEGQLVGGGGSSSSPYLGVSSFASGSHMKMSVAEHQAATGVGDLQKQRDMSFTNFRRLRV